jgi:hypothetical protein
MIFGLSTPVPFSIIVKVPRNKKKARFWKGTDRWRRILHFKSWLNNSTR